jgi:hemolysin activation/secretion protein
LRNAQKPVQVCSFLLAALLVSGVPDALGQDIRPGDDRLEFPGFGDEEGVPPVLTPLPPVPDFEAERQEPGRTLPPVEVPEAAGTRAMAGGRRVEVEAIRITGNTVIDSAELDRIAAAYVGRPLGYADLHALRDELTLAYVNAGYITSGAVIPEQDFEDGVLKVQIVEGRLSHIEIENQGRLRNSYFASRLERHADEVVDVAALQRRLRILQQDPRVKSIHAYLRPDEGRGFASLLVRVEEAVPWFAELEGSNYSSPALGEARGLMQVGNRNVTTFGDTLQAEYQVSWGLKDVRARWELPLNRWDTAFEAYTRLTWSEIVEDPLDTFDIENDTKTFGFGLVQPVYRTENHRAQLFVHGERRRSESTLEGEGFSFVPGPHDGVATVLVLRPGLEWVWRTANQVLATRSQFSIGLDGLGSTINPGDIPDSRFFAWLGQLQYAQRLPGLLDSQIVARADVQLSDRPLFSIEQFAIGGHATVRGYRENLLVHDNGVVASLELRVPLPIPSIGEWDQRIELAPFIDYGKSWNTDRGEIGPTELISIGIGTRMAFARALSFEVYYGYDLKDIPRVGDGLQDRGVQLALTWRY